MNAAEIRQKEITKTSIVGILANVLLAGFKAFVGLLAGSIAIVLDAVNNLTDALSSVITIVGIKLAKRSPDHAHPYGYGRIEYFSAVIIAGLVLATGITSLVESAKKIFSPELPDYQLATIVVVVAAVVGKLLLGKYVTSQGKKYHSDALVASGTDASFDAIISASTLLGAAVTLIFHISIDGILGAIISLLIIKAGTEMLLEAVSDIMGNRADAEITKDIRKTVASIDGVQGAYDLILHNYGPESAIGSVHVEIPATMTAREVHVLIKKIQEKIYEEFHVFMTVGIYAVDDAYAAQSEAIRAKAKTHEGVLGTHGYFFDTENKYISFDVVTDFTVKDRDALCRDFQAELQEMFPGYRIEFNLDTNYSD